MAFITLSCNTMLMYFSAGIVFGVVVPVVVAALFIVKILWRYRKRRKKGHIKRHHNGIYEEFKYVA